MVFFRNYLPVALLGVITLSMTFQYQIIHLNFLLNREYIANYLCENRNKPIAVCGGVCYLSEQLQSAAENVPEEHAVSIEFKLNFIHVIQWISNIEPEHIYIKDRVKPYLQFYSYLVASSMLIPPEHA